MKDRIMDQAVMINDFIHSYSERSNYRIHETIAALDLLKANLMRQMFHKNDELFHDRLRRMADGEKP